MLRLYGSKVKKLPKDTDLKEAPLHRAAHALRLGGSCGTGRASSEVYNSSHGFQSWLTHRRRSHFRPPVRQSRFQHGVMSSANLSRCSRLAGSAQKGGGRTLGLATQAAYGHGGAGEPFKLRR